MAKTILALRDFRPEGLSIRRDGLVFKDETIYDVPDDVAVNLASRDMVEILEDVETQSEPTEPQQPLEPSEKGGTKKPSEKK
jgi:hypothetical protein